MSGKVIIVSGGMDSTTLLYDLHERNAVAGPDKGHLYALSFDYGSKHNACELPLAVEHCAFLGIPHEIVKLDFIANHFRSDLLKTGDAIPEGHYEDENMKKTVVPFRNGIMLSIAVGFAESLNCSSVFLGAHAGDHAVYPDCRASFRNAFSDASQLGTYAGVKVEAPYEMKSKADIVSIGSILGLDYGKTWSCYKGGSIACGRCGTCVERIEAFKIAGVVDPIQYDPEGIQFAIDLLEKRR